MANPYYQPFSDTEFATFSALNNEFIEMHGIQVYYLPKVAGNLDYLYGEDPLEHFDESYETTMLLENVTSFTGSDMFTKFGIDVKDEVVFFIHKDKFVEYTGQDVPLIGDLLYLKWAGKSLFEITFCEDESIFYHLGNWPVWKISAMKYEWSRQDVDLSGTDPYGTADEYMETLESTDDEYTDNENLESDASDIDFDETNPFGAE